VITPFLLLSSFCTHCSDKKRPASPESFLREKQRLFLSPPPAAPCPYYGQRDHQCFIFSEIPSHWLITLAQTCSFSFISSITYCRTRLHIYNFAMPEDGEDFSDVRRGAPALKSFPSPLKRRTMGQFSLSVQKFKRVFSILNPLPGHSGLLPEIRISRPKNLFFFSCFPFFIQKNHRESSLSWVKVIHRMFFAFVHTSPLPLFSHCTFIRLPRFPF